MSEFKLTTEPLFGALVRPALLAGVNYEFFVIALMLCFIAFIIFSSICCLLLFLPLHAFGWLVCKYDAHFFVIVAKQFLLPAMPNKGLWGVRCYEPF